MNTRIGSLLLALCLIAGLWIAPVSAQDDATPDGTYNVSPQAQAVYDGMVAGQAELYGNEDSPIHSLMQSCTTIALLQAVIQPDELPLPETVTIETVEVEGLSGAWFTPENTASDQVLYYIHGGGFIINSVEIYTSFLALLAERTGYTVFSLDYRLAPKHPFPAGKDDVEMGYRWLLEQGYSADHIAVAGDSAGGNLIIALLLTLRDADEPMPAGAWLFAPLVDFTRASSTESSVELSGFFNAIFTLMRNCYLDGTDPTDTQVSPLFADLDGLPPLLLSVGTRDALLGSNARFVQLARQAGVDATLDVWDGMWHVWAYDDPMLPESIRLHEMVGAWLDSVMPQ